MYNDFMNFSNTILTTLGHEKQTDIIEYIEYLIKNQIPITEWKNSNTYVLFIKNRLVTMSYNTAIFKTISFFVEEMKKIDSEWYEYFDKQTSSAIVWDIMQGNVSPWIIFGTTKGRSKYDSFNSDELKYIHSTVDPVMWKRKVKLKKTFVQ